MNDPNKLRRLILSAAEVIRPRVESWADPVALLGAIAEVETDFGLCAVARHEPAFDWGGALFSKSLWALHGSVQACSFSSFQIMFPVCVELGLDPHTHPCELNDDEKAIHWVLEYVRRRILDKGCVTVYQFADAYNSGNFQDSFVPRSYVDKFEEAYRSVVERRGLKN